MHHQKWISLLLALCLTATIVPAKGLAETPSGGEAAADVPAGISDGSELYTAAAYADYALSHADVAAAQTAVTLDVAAYAESSGEVSQTEDGLYTGEDSSVRWKITVPESALYILQIDYTPTDETTGSIDRTLTIDGALPFREAGTVTFSRAFGNAEIGRDSAGNDLSPESTQILRKMTMTVRDGDGMTAGSLRFYFTAGEHTLELKATRSAVVLHTLTLAPPESLPDYKEYLQQHGGLSDTPGEVTFVEAETPTEKSSYTITALNDRTSADTTPQDPVKVRLNTIGGGRWQYAGQRITWTIRVEETGFYRIAPRVLQNAYAGGYVSRRVLIDGTVPFAEAEAVRFDYADHFRVEDLGDYRFYLTAGEHSLTMEVTVGDMAEYIRRIQTVLDDLNTDYRRILTITGSTPDRDRDYDFESLIPDILDDFGTQADALKAIVAELQQQTGLKGDFTSVINKLVFVLQKMHRDTDNIAGSYSSFRDNLSSLATWVQQIMMQPMTIDKIYVVPEGAKLLASGTGWLGSLWFQIKAFAGSFFEDYQSLSGDITAEDVANNNVITVWVTTGFDQSMVIQQLIRQSFTPSTGIKVNLQLVAAGSLLPSVLAGRGPDVSLFNGDGDPVNYAVRHAVVSLSQFDDLGKVTARFPDSAMTPYRLAGETYALPDTLSFPMMFYRKDIFYELGLEAPATWEEFYQVVKVLQRHNMQTGFPVNTQAAVSNANLKAYAIFLYQSGGSLYNEGQTASAIDSDVSMNAFKKMTDLFTLYKLPVEYSFANRFRSGEMPLGIADYTTYNTLTVFAPEIRDLWTMAPLPGTVQEDGSINYTSPSGGTAVMMLRGAKDEQKSWTFMKWWTEADTQSQYSAQMESLLGPASKQPVSNVEALSSMAWTAEELQNLRTQMQEITGTPEIPGGYYTSRAVDFAFNSVYIDKEDAYSAILDNVNDINQEITRKRREFGLE